MQTWGINLRSGLMAVGMWPSSHRPARKVLKKVKAARATPYGVIWPRSEMRSSAEWESPGRKPGRDDAPCGGGQVGKPKPGCRIHSAWTPFKKYQDKQNSGLSNGFKTEWGWMRRLGFYILPSAEQITMQRSKEEHLKLLDKLSPLYSVIPK